MAEAWNRQHSTDRLKRYPIWAGNACVAVSRPVDTLTHGSVWMVNIGWQPVHLFVHALVRRSYQNVSTKFKQSNYIFCQFYVWILRFIDSTVCTANVNMCENVTTKPSLSTRLFHSSEIECQMGHDGREGGKCRVCSRRPFVHPFASTYSVRQLFMCHLKSHLRVIHTYSVLTPHQCR